jgi:glutaredoxin 3
MATVVIYLTKFCPFCVRAKKMLDGKGVAYQEIRVDKSLDKRHEMENKSKRTSVPQIFINDQHIGGFDDMAALEYKQELDALLAK